MKIILKSNNNKKEIENNKYFDLAKNYGLLGGGVVIFGFFLIVIMSLGAEKFDLYSFILGIPVMMFGLFYLYAAEKLLEDHVRTHLIEINNLKHVEIFDHVIKVSRSMAQHVAEVNFIYKNGENLMIKFDMDAFVELRDFMKQNSDIEITKFSY